MATMIRLTFLACLLAACAGHEHEKTTHPVPTPPEKRAAIAPPAVASISNVVTPESVLHDPQQDVYFISNVFGGLEAVDGNGFITRVDADTLRVDLKWIENGKNGARLDGPKGMAIVGDTLYVSDVLAVRKFDRRTGAPLGEIPLPGATMINDLATDGSNVYVSDTAIRSWAGQTFVATNTDAIWKISGDRATKIASGAELHQPNGLAFHDGALWVAPFAGNELYRLDGTERDVVIEVPRGQLDGLVILGDGTRIVSSWQGSTIYRESSDGEFTPLLNGIAHSADIGYDAKRRRLLVPRSATNEVTIHQLSR